MGSVTSPFGNSVRAETERAAKNRVNPDVILKALVHIHPEFDPLWSKPVDVPSSLLQQNQFISLLFDKLQDLKRHSNTKFYDPRSSTLQKTHISSSVFVFLGRNVLLTLI